MSNVIPTGMSTIDVIKLIREGQKLRCPACLSTIKTVPETWVIGMPLHGIECPTDQKHFVIHCDDARLMNEMRTRMKEIAKNK